MRLPGRIVLAALVVAAAAGGWVLYKAGPARLRPWLP